MNQLMNLYAFIFVVGERKPWDTSPEVSSKQDFMKMTRSHYIYWLFLPRVPRKCPRPISWIDGDRKVLRERTQLQLWASFCDATNASSLSEGIWHKNIKIYWR